MKTQGYRGQNLSRGFSEPRRPRGRRGRQFKLPDGAASLLGLLQNGKTRSVFASIALVLVVAVTLTVGQLSGCDGAPSWSSVFACSGQRESYVDAGKMEVHAIDVGQGDCVLVRGGGANILIDAGENGMGAGVAKYLRREGVTSLDWVVCTHPHSDHIGGMDEVIASVKTYDVLMPALPESIIPTTSTYSDLLDTIAECGLSITYAEVGDVYTFADMTMTVVYAGSGNEEDGYNDFSIGLRFACGDMSFLSCGDASQTSEQTIIQSGVQLQSLLYKSSHHGSSDANSDGFLDAVNPQYSFICCGANNDYGHPHDSLIARYNAHGISYLRTDVNGSILYKWDGYKLSVSTEK